jgi:hypothetical protein
MVSSAKFEMVLLEFKHFDADELNTRIAQVDESSGVDEDTVNELQAAILARVIHLALEWLSRNKFDGKDPSDLVQVHLFSTTKGHHLLLPDVKYKRCGLMGDDEAELKHLLVPSTLPLMKNVWDEHTILFPILANIDISTCILFCSKAAAAQEYDFPGRLLQLTQKDDDPFIRCVDKRMVRQFLAERSYSCLACAAKMASPKGCPFCDACYCSSACRKADRKAHKKDCHQSGGSNLNPDNAFLSRLLSVTLYPIL